MDSTEERGLVARPSTLDTIGAEVRAEHEAALAAARSAVEHAIRAGQGLIEAKGRVKHGEWLPWIDRHLPFSEDTAELYMALARNSERVRNLPSIRAARAELRAIMEAPRRPVWPLEHDYLEPPFTTLNARTPEWQWRRDRLVSALGIKPALGRPDGLTYGKFANPDFGAATVDRYGNGSTSTFDPALCEVIYNWLAVRDGTVLDPFAGGSVRGMVAAFAGLRYVGIELRQEQVDANRQQARDAEDHWETDDELPRWIAGDSAVILADPDAHDIPMADLIFTSPPWGDRERYSDHPADLSNMAPDDFDAAYRNILTLAVERLHDDRFACVAIGNIRRRKAPGHIRDLVGVTHRAMADAGAPLYNEPILLNPVGTGAIRARNQFPVSRKLVPVYQPLPIYAKGNPATATHLIEGRV